MDGPWEKVGDKPVMDLTHVGHNAESEDAYVWIENGIFKMIMRDMGYWNHEYGLYFESNDGLNWSDPKVAFKDAKHYFKEDSKGILIAKFLIGKVDLKDHNCSFEMESLNTYLVLFKVGNIIFLQELFLKLINLCRFKNSVKGN